MKVRVVTPGRVKDRGLKPLWALPTYSPGFRHYALGILLSFGERSMFDFPHIFATSAMMHLHHKTLKYLLVTFSAFGALCSAHAQNTFVALQPSVKVEISRQPAAVMVRGNYNLLYELHFINFSSSPLAITGVSIVDGKDSTVLKKFTGAEMLSRLNRPGAKVSDNNLGPASLLVFYVDIEVAHSKLPGNIFHEITFNDPGGKVFEIHAAESKLAKAADVIGSPLRGGPWAAVFSPLWPRGHRRVIFTVDGKARIPGRFAIDFIRLDRNGKQAGGNENVISNWYGYSADVLAVADGTIASTRDDFSESPTLSGHPAYDAAKATGNYISLRLPGGSFAFYEHLKPGSVIVRSGQQVRKGDVIAKVGFTGQSTGPHLHFHIADRDSPLGAEGLPFTFEKFKLVGTYRDFADFGKAPWVPVDVDVINEFPESNCVVSFKETRN